MGLPSSKSILNFRGEVQVGPLKKRFIPREFFQTRIGLYFLDETERVLSVTQDTAPHETVIKLSYFDSPKPAYNREIKDQLPEKHEVELWQIAELIERQKNGEDGALLNNGKENILYVTDFMLTVRRFVDEPAWLVTGCEFDGFLFAPGDRVFSIS